MADVVLKRHCRLLSFFYNYYISDPRSKFQEDRTEIVVAIVDETFCGHTHKHTHRQTLKWLSVQCNSWHWTDINSLECLSVCVFVCVCVCLCVCLCVGRKGVTWPTFAVLVVKYFTYLKHTALDRLQVRLNVILFYICPMPWIALDRQQCRIVTAHLH